MLSYLEISSRVFCAVNSVLSMINPVSQVVFSQGGYSPPVSGIARITVLPVNKGVLARIGNYIFRNKKTG